MRPASTHPLPRSGITLLVVMGRWAPETRTFLSLLARAKARGECRLLQKRAEQAWRLRWGSLLSCSAARAFASTLLELPGASGSEAPRVSVLLRVHTAFPRCCVQSHVRQKKSHVYLVGCSRAFSISSVVQQVNATHLIASCSNLYLILRGDARLLLTRLQSKKQPNRNKRRTR